MRTRVVRERANRRACLEVRLGRKEKLDVGGLRVLEAARCQTLLTPELVEGGEERDILRYDVTGLTTLREFVRRDVLSHQKYERMLASVAEVAGSCQAVGIELSSLLLESSRVMASFEGVLHFASVPLEGGAPSSRTTVLGLVSLLSDTRRLRFNLEEDEEIARAVARFHDASDSFDIEAYCELLGEKFGMVPQTLLRPHPVTDSRVGVSETLGSTGRGEELGRPPQGVAAWRPEDHRAVPVTLDLRDIRGGEAGTHSDACGSGASGPYGSRYASQGGFPGPETPNDKGAGAPECHAEPPGEAFDSLAGEQTYLLVRLNTGERYPLAADEALTLGRSSGCSVQLLGNPDISRRQASVLCEHEGCVLCDLGSANGTTVRGHELGENESARIAFGETFQLAGEPFSIVPDQNA